MQPIYSKGADYESYSLGEFSPKIVILDNNFKTIEEQKKRILSQGISLILTTSVDRAIALFHQFKNSAAYLFDMHMEGEKKVGTVSTLGGLAVGLALVSFLTNDGRSQEKMKYVATISEYNQERDTEATYISLKRAGQDVERIKKDEGLEKLDKFIKVYKDAYYNDIRSMEINQNVTALISAFGELSPDENGINAQVAALMGYAGQEMQIWESSRDEILKNAGRDIKERIEALIYIKHGLMLYFETPGEQRAWVNRARVEFGGKSVWDILMEGNMEGINTVAGVVNREIG